MTELSASHALLVITIGACAYLGSLRMWAGRNDQGPIHWASAWALTALVFATARLVELNASEPYWAVAAARLECALGPLMTYALCAMVGSVSGWRPAGALGRAWAALACAFSALMLVTPWFITQQVTVGRDLSGNAFWCARGGPALALLPIAMGAALVWCLGRVRHSSELSRGERRLALLTLVVYAAMGISSVAEAMRWIPFPGVAEYAPLVVSLAAGRIIASRQLRLERLLAERVAARTAALRESESRYRDLIEAAPIGLLSIDVKGQLEHANAALLAMLGSTSAEFASSFNVASEENAQRSGFSAMLHRALSSGEALHEEFEFNTWWGKRIATRTLVSPYRDDSGTVVGALAVVEEITERRAAQQRLGHAQRMEAVGQLSAGIAHEINNPMAYVRANLGVLGEELRALAKDIAARDPAAPQLARIAALLARVGPSLAAVERTVGLVRDLRDFSRASSLEREPTDVSALLDNAARLLSTRRDGLADVALECTGSLPVSADPGQLRLVFLNLLMHALRAAGPTGHVRAGCARVGDEVLISIHDDGDAISPQERARLFEPLAPTRGAGEPTLGLYVSQQIVQEHDGRIEVLSGAGHGTTFVVRLPIARAEDA